MSAKGCVNLPADLAKVFFTIVTRESIAAADERVGDLTKRLEATQTSLRYVAESGFVECKDCHSIKGQGTCIQCSIECACSRGGTPARVCYNCYEHESNRNQRLRCGTCVGYGHQICKKHCSYASCDFEGCKGAPYDDVSCNSLCPACDTCGARMCRAHQDNTTRDARCVTCSAELKALHAAVKEKKKRFRKRKGPTKRL
jgi:hypothetical protein